MDNRLPIEDIAIADPKIFLYKFLGSHTLAMLATANKNSQPEAAVVEFSALPTLEIIFDTYSYFRKYANLMLNQHVAMVIGWENEKTLQYEGKAFELIGAELADCRSLHLQNFPDAIKFEKYSGMKYFKVIPSWIRYTDMSGFPWKKLELEFNNG